VLSFTSRPLYPPPPVTIDYALRRVQANHNGFKLNSTHQLLICADYLSILDRSVHTVKKNTEALVLASKEIGL